MGGWIRLHWKRPLAMWSGATRVCAPSLPSSMAVPTSGSWNPVGHNPDCKLCLTLKRLLPKSSAKLRVTGRKAERKIYYRHSGFPGGIKQTNFAKLHAARPERVLQKAVKGMLPKGPLGYAMLRKLKIYAGGEHPHSAQQPKNLEI